MLNILQITTCSCSFIRSQLGNCPSYESHQKQNKFCYEQRIRLKDKIETEDGKPKDGDSAEIVQKELKRMKIVNNRENIWDVKLTDTHFVREREQIWKMEKSDGEKWI